MIEHLLEYICAKNVLIDEVLTKLFQKWNGAVFFAPHGKTGTQLNFQQYTASQYRVRTQPSPLCRETSDFIIARNLWLPNNSDFSLV